MPDHQTEGIRYKITVGARSVKKYILRGECSCRADAASENKLARMMILAAG
jgi:hypothetical protein